MEYLVEKLFTPVFTALLVWFIEWRRAKKEETRDEVEEVNREINMATMELAYATSVAVEKGSTNGEMKKARKAYDKAVEHQRKLGLKLIDKQK